MLSRRSDWMRIANLLIKLSWLPLCCTWIVPGSTDKKIKIIENSRAIEHSLSVKRGVRPRSRTHLIVACLDPLLIKVMTPKITLAVIHSVGLPAVGAPGSMRACSAPWHSQSGGNHVGVPLAASRQGVMVFLLMRARARHDNVG
jgi:hypothetical protein